MLEHPNKTKRAALALVAFGVALLSFVHGLLSHYEPRPRVLSFSSDIRLMQLYGADGRISRMPSYADDAAVLLFFLATQCAHCDEVAPAWRTLASARRTKWERAKRAGAVPTLVLSYSSPASTEAFVTAHGLAELPILYVDAVGVNELNAWAAPATIVLRHGREALFWDGVLSEDDLEAVLREVATR
jgi:hypothetical protein